MDSEDVPFGLEPKAPKPAPVDPSYRAIPNSPDAEAGVLGCALLDPNDVMPQCLEKIRLPEVFYDNVHKTIWSALADLFEKKVAIDPITLQQRLKDKGQLEGSGGLVFITGLMEKVPSAANIEYYLTIVLDKYTFRSAIRECTRLIDSAYEHIGTADEYLDSVQKSLNGLAVHRYRSNLVPVRKLVSEVLKETQDLLDRTGAIDGIPTGLADLDNICWGMHNGEFILLAARPSQGKSSLCGNIAEHVAVDLNMPVAIFTLEMNPKAIVHRMICARAQVNGRKLRDFPERDVPKFMTAAKEIAKAPLYVDDASGNSSLQIRAKARKMVKDYGCRLLCVDYLQLVEPPRRREHRATEVAEVSKDLCALGKELNIPVLALSQLSREMDKEKGRRPKLSDLKESGALEQDADTVWMLYQKEVKGEKGAQDYGNLVTAPVGLIVAKQRGGENTEIPLVFIKSWTKFTLAAKESPAEQTQMPV